ncbi:hypothetical protein Sfulv_00520 [Streptomyces fulvorobeus]|uniref:Uncharacterized protein n=1 Tax=Streptomyces fulvorobeus TaxID=284028 RepID=A0A7J0BYD6_9ACTN|nr:hypothetical protein Sfulv_00520 [Streptomyces fulvorobeus]
MSSGASPILAGKGYPDTVAVGVRRDDVRAGAEAARPRLPCDPSRRTTLSREGDAAGSAGGPDPGKSPPPGRA